MREKSLVRLYRLFSTKRGKRFGTRLYCSMQEYTCICLIPSAWDPVVCLTKRRNVSFQPGLHQLLGLNTNSIKYPCNYPAVTCVLQSSLAAWNEQRRVTAATCAYCRSGAVPSARQPRRASNWRESRGRNCANERTVVADILVDLPHSPSTAALHIRPLLWAPTVHHLHLFAIPYFLILPVDGVIYVPVSQGELNAMLLIVNGGGGSGGCSGQQPFGYF